MNEKIIKIETEINYMKEKIVEHDKKIEELSDVYVALTKVNDKVDSIDTDIKEIKQDFKEIKEKPSKKLENITNYILSALIGGIIGYLLIKLGLK